MFFGVAYYPEHWPEERWPVDAQMMQEAGINGVRMGEFAWSKFEPTEGNYDFEWMERAIALLGEQGIKTMMCTSSRNPPPWLYRKYPGIRNVRADGQQNNYGHRYTVCHNNPTFVALSQEFDRVIVEHFAGNPDIIAWHIDNEIGSGNTCYCEVCHAEFIAYLRDKYGTVQSLNEKWGTHFWSSAFSAFEEVPLPVGVRFPNPSLALEYARFQSKVNAGFAYWRYELIKRHHPQVWVTTNFQTGDRTHTDNFELGRATDVYGTNFYPPFAPEFDLDYYRGARGQLLILEQRSGQPHWGEGTRPGWMRLWAYRSIAHGASGINFFRWRPCRWGQEEYWHAVLPHSGRPNRRYRELKQMGAELNQIGALIDMTRPEAKVAVVLSYQSRWSLDAVSSSGVLPLQFSNDGMNAHAAAGAYHEALMDLSICTDAMDPTEDLSQYALVIAPRLYCVDARTVENLVTFVENGGVLCLTPRSGVVDEYNVIFNQPAPGPLRGIAGVEVDDYTALDGPLPLQAGADGPAGIEEATGWADEIIPTSAEVVATFDGGWLAGAPAITVNAYGKGKVVYVGCLLRNETLKAFVGWLCELADVPSGLGTPVGVRAYERRNDAARLLFLTNFSAATQSILLDGEWENTLTGEFVSQVELKPAAVQILKRAL
jgi:beta-galactosidase